jgi:uncharacterized protein (DUF2141 family)
MLRSGFLLTAIMFSIRLMAQSGEITVNIAGFRNDRGQCIVHLYNDKAGFPAQPQKAFKTTIGTIHDGKCIVKFSGFTPGIYAVSVLHDENGNGKTDTNFIGIPTEGLGTSNNPKTFGMPGFDDAKFQFGGNNLTIDIKLKYLLK